ncbi:MAG: HNH endonuclease [Bacteroidaceae bacterium]|nr:HNH endonuclease [Bacteroidaceae bacterium]
MRGSYARTPQPKAPRTDRAPGNRSLFNANKKIILATQTVCAICGKPVDKSIKYPDPMSPTVDHIIPVSKNGDPVSLDNLQLAHRYCNRMKSDKLPSPTRQVEENRKLPLTENWATF